MEGGKGGHVEEEEEVEEEVFRKVHLDGLLVL